MTQDKHTALPWAYNVGKRNGYWPYLERGKNGSNVIQDMSGSVETARADAAFIVRAVNNHYQLIEALESIANNTCCGGCQEAALVARQALSNAKGVANDSMEK